MYYKSESCIRLLTANIAAVCALAFYGAVNLEEVSIPEGVTQIDDMAFEGCTALKEIYYGGTEDDWQAVSIGDAGSSRSSTGSIAISSPGNSILAEGFVNMHYGAE